MGLEREREFRVELESIMLMWPSRSSGREMLRPLATTTGDGALPCDLSEVNYHLCL